jgi:hypothetical protein
MSKWNELGADDTRAYFIGNDFKTVRSAYEAAYPWAGFVRPKVRADLFRSASIEIGELPYDSPEDVATAARSADSLARRLEHELDRAFPLRLGDGVRARFRRRE